MFEVLYADVHLLDKIIQEGAIGILASNVYLWAEH